MNRSQGGDKRLNGSTVLICSKSEYYTTNKGKKNHFYHLEAPIKHHGMSADDNANELCNEPSQFSFNLSEIEGDTKPLREGLVLGSKRNEHPSSLNGGLNP